MEGLDVSIMPQADGYMVENSGTYFKIGKREGHILERIINGENKELIIQDEGITKEEFKQLLNELEDAGVIGEKKKKKENILFYKIPLFQADKMFSLIVKFIRSNKVILKNALVIINMIVAIGFILMLKNGREIFTLSTFNMSRLEYVFLYISFLISICLHELAHGTVCRYVGGKVGTIGVILILFTPAVYCDISGIRMVENRKKQIAASAAGLYVNFIGMCLASIVFTFVKRTIFAAYITLSLTTIISNIIPVLRLDGYWILSFGTGITNLYDKSRKGVRRIFSKCSAKERFMAIYGIVTYVFIIVAFLSLGISIIEFIKYLIKFFF